MACVPKLRHAPAWLLAVTAVVCAAADPPTVRQTKGNVREPVARRPVDMSIEWLQVPRPAISREKSPALLQPAKPFGPQQVWMLRVADRTLSGALQRWTQSAGWQLVWEAERDFVVEVDLQFEGAFSAVLDTVMQSLADTDYPLQAVANPQVKVLRIRRQHEANR